MQLDLLSSIFNISFYIGDLIEPIIGSWITINYYFHMSAYFACFLSTFFGIIFGYYFNNEINNNKYSRKELDLQLIEKKLSNINNNKD